jgi:orotate phosphoribosyltransferase
VPVRRRLQTRPRRLEGLQRGRRVAALEALVEIADGPERALSLRRGFSLSPGERVLVVEDVLTTGGSTRETMDVARSAGATVVGAAALVDRSGGTISFGVPYRALVEIALPTYEAARCPLCAQGIPITKPGSRPT